MELREVMKEITKGWENYSVLNGGSRPAGWEMRLAEANRLIYNLDNIPSHRWEYAIKEALTTSDFPFLFGDTLDRQLLSLYKVAPADWKKFTKLTTNRDFRKADRYQIFGGDNYLDEVSQKGEYLASPRTEARYQIQLKKYGRQFDISWESIVNDDLGALKDTPQRFANAASRTEHRLVTSQYYHNVVLATAGRGNLSVNPLTIANLETGIEWFAARTDPNGEAIPTRPKYLVVVPALEMTARAILTSASKMGLAGATTIAGAPDVWVPNQNIVAQMGLELVVDPYITILGATTTPLSSVASWFLFTPPGELAVLEAAHLRGHERPEICMKASDKVTVGGAAITPMSGDFASDNIFYRVRLPFGVTTLDWRGFYFGGHLD